MKPGSAWGAAYFGSSAIACLQWTSQPHWNRPWFRGIDDLTALFGVCSSKPRGITAIILFWVARSKYVSAGLRQRSSSMPERLNSTSTDAIVGWRYGANPNHTS